MKFELKTENEYFNKPFFTIFLTIAITAFIVIISNISLKISNISRHYEINHLCRLLVVNKSSYNLKKLSNLTNQTNKQKILDLCREIIKN